MRLLPVKVANEFQHTETQNIARVRIHTETQNIARVRIHVKREIRRIKENHLIKLFHRFLQEPSISCGLFHLFLQILEDLFFRV